MSREFDWDERKARGNTRRHRVPFEEAISVFSDPHAVVLFDAEHSGAEARYVIMGVSDRGRVLTVVYTERGRTIRIITAHRATRRERRSYG